MSEAAERAERARHAVRERWRQEGNPVLTRAASIVVTRADELSEAQRTAIHAATEGASNDDA